MQAATRRHGALRLRREGFTLVELLVVLAIVGLLVTLALPRYFNSVDRSREAVLTHDLKTMREAIDRFYADYGRYPTGLVELAQRRYLRSVPVDPITESNGTWIMVSPADGVGMQDVRSGAQGQSLAGTAFETF